ncbi:MAG: hypothetical protein ACSHX0_06800 [Akkermansiaceae bacterium]
MKSINESRDYVLQQAKKNIEAVEGDPKYVKQAKEVNASLASIVTMERTTIMNKALELQQAKHDGSTING